MDLAAVIAPNGLGHFRRVVRQLDALLAARPALKVGLICEAWQLETMRAWTPLQRVLSTQPQVATGQLRRTFRWVNDPAALDELSLTGWLEDVRGVEWMQSARRVLSDNLCGILQLRPDAALGGSFLWSDVFEPFAPSNEAVARFVVQERALLAACKPPMLCVQGLAMPGVLRQARPVQLPWLCEWTTSRPASRQPGECVGILGGATGTAAGAMAAMAHALLADDRLELRVEKALKDREFSSAARVAAFTHDEAGYQALSLAFVRPGVGTLTDCVAGQVPMVLLDEPDNLEMAHNARAIAGLGLGELLPETDAARALEVARRNLEPSTWHARVAAFAGLQRDGLLKAVDWLANWVGA